MCEFYLTVKANSQCRPGYFVLCLFNGDLHRCNVVAVRWRNIGARSQRAGSARVYTGIGWRAGEVNQRAPELQTPDTHNRIYGDGAVVRRIKCMPIVDQNRVGDH
jgi:hypothetical protein